MALQLQLNSQASQRFQVTLDGQSVIIEVFWNETYQCWFMNLKQTDETPISTGRRLSTNNKTFEHVLVDFSGDFVPESLVTPNTALGRNSWGNTHQLVYYGADE